MQEIRNKVAQSGLITIDLSHLLPQSSRLMSFDLKPFLFQEMILREKEFRQALKTVDWLQYADKHVAVFCSADAIIPVWAYMLIASHLAPFAKEIFNGTPNDLRQKLLIAAIQNADISEYKDKRVILKGCGRDSVSEAAYMSMSIRLHSVVKSLMYGEACSTVPVYKQKQ